MTTDLAAMPGRIGLLPRDKHGYPVPWFVAWIHGKPDFRVVRRGGIDIALMRKLCWVCGVPFARQEPRAFTIGPMCAVNRVSAEPPSHEECAIWSATHCPFLSNPNMKRRDKHMPEDAEVPAGISIRRNPGVALVWVTAYRAWSTFDDGNGGMLFNIGDPLRALWFAEGRPATRTEVLASIDSGLPLLAAMAEQDGHAAMEALDGMHAAALEYLPPETGLDRVRAAVRRARGGDAPTQVRGYA